MATKTATSSAAKKSTRTAAGKSAALPLSASGGAVSEAQIDAVAQQLARAVRGRAPQAPQPLAPSVNLISELHNIDFRKLIGGPLQAAVDAQVASSLASVNFINEVGFKLTDPNDPNSKRELVMVDFTHTRKDVDAAGVATTKESFIKVPLLAMLQIPSLRIDHVEIIFNVKLNSVETSSVSDKLNVGAEFKGGWGPVSLKVSVAYQRQTAQGVEVKKEYALNVNVKAVQDEIPSGLEKILNLLAA